MQRQSVLGITSILSTAAAGTPADSLIASANVGQTITIIGTSLNANTDVVFPTIRSSDGLVGTRTVKPSRVLGGGSSIEVVVPDDAVTGTVTLSGGSGSSVLQIVPTIVDIDLTGSNFLVGSGFQILGSGFSEGDLTVRFGGAPVIDTGVFTGPDVFNTGLNTRWDRTDNDAINVLVPAGAAPGLITVETDGGTSASLLISATQLSTTALAGTPVSPAQPSANAGQTLRVLGSGFDLTTEIIFPIVDSLGNISNRAVLPDLAKTDGTLIEVRVPDDAMTGNVQVIGANANLFLQIVPTLRMVERFSGSQVRLLGSGFTENSNLSVDFNGETVNDTGLNVDVSLNFLANDTLSVHVPSGGGNLVSVITAGGVSAPVTIATTDPADVGEMRDLAIFPASAGVDSGRLVVVERFGAIKVLDPVTLALVRTINRPGAAADGIGLDFLTEPITVQDPVRGAVAVPLGSLIVVNEDDSPDRLYYLNPAGTGTILADVPLGGGTPLDLAGVLGAAYHPLRHTLFVLRSGDLVAEINPATGVAIKSFHTGFSVGAGDIAVDPVSRNLWVAGSGGRLVSIHPETGRVIGHYDPIGNTQLGTIALSQQGVGFQSFGDISGLAFNSLGVMLGTTSNIFDSLAERILKLKLPDAPTDIMVGGFLAVAIEGTPANSALPSANTRQRIQLVGSGFTRSTEVEFPRVNRFGEALSNNGQPGFVRVQVDAVSPDGTVVEVVVPDEAVTGNVQIAGVDGPGLFLQIVPTIRTALPSDPVVNFDGPVEGQRWSLFGSGLVEGDTLVSFGGVAMNENSTGAELDVSDVAASGFSRANGRLELTVPERGLAGPISVQTDGGSFLAGTVPIQAPAFAGIVSIAARAGQGTPVNSSVASANAGQIITLQGFGFSSTTNIVFAAVAEDGTRSQVVVRPVTVPNSGQITVRVPALAVTGPVTVAGSSFTVDLQIVPLLNGISAGSITPDGFLRLAASGIPEGGSGAGQSVTYTIGAGSVSDTSGTTGPDVFSALDAAVEIDLSVPADATGSDVTVTTAGGSATFRLSDLASSTVPAETQGSGAPDGVGGTLATAFDLAVAANAQLTVTGRIDPAADVDIFKLTGVEGGGLLSVSATGAQSTNARFILFDETGAILTGPVSSLSRFVLQPRNGYFLGYSGFPNTGYNPVTGSGATNASNVGDYSLSLRYGGPGTTSLNAFTATAAMGVPTSSNIASANTRQTITIAGENFSGSTRVRFTTFNGDSPQSGLTEREVTPASVAADGLSLTVAVPDDAVTGPVRVSDEAGGLILQIVPVVSDIDDLSTSTGARPACG
ncbi:MAG: hypothetical protein AAB676_06200 [Verrucomicrobiota bacterium]